MASINCLNEDCLIEIFKYSDIFQILKVCRHWRKVALESWQIFKFYDSSVWGIDEYGTLYIDILTLQELLIRCGKYLKVLIVDEPKSICINPESRIQISELNEKSLSIILPHSPNLRYVKAFLKYNSIEAIQFLTKHCEHLKELILNCEADGHFNDETRFQDALSELFKSKRKLKRLNYKGSMWGKSLECLPPDMEDISIRSFNVNCELLVKVISKFQNLRKLELDSSKNVSHLFKALEVCSKSLKVLIVRNCNARHLKIEEIPTLSALEILKLRRNYWLHDDFLFRVAKRFKRLKSLMIEDDRRSFNEGISGMSQLPLEELSLILSSEIGPAVSQFRTLRSLSLESTFVDLEILCEVIKNCPKLEELFIVNYDRKEWNYKVLEAAALAAENRELNSILKIWIDGQFWKAVKSPMLYEEIFVVKL